MDVLDTLVNAGVVSAVGVVLGLMVHGVRKEIAALRAEFRAEILELRREMAQLRSDLTRVALAVGVEPRAESR